MSASAYLEYLPLTKDWWYYYFSTEATCTGNVEPELQTRSQLHDMVEGRKTSDEATPRTILVIVNQVAPTFRVLDKYVEPCI